MGQTTLSTAVILLSNNDFAAGTEQSVPIFFTRLFLTHLWSCYSPKNSGTMWRSYKFWVTFLEIEASQSSSIFV